MQYANLRDFADEIAEFLFEYEIPLNKTNENQVKIIFLALSTLADQPLDVDHLPLSMIRARMEELAYE